MAAIRDMAKFTVSKEVEDAVMGSAALRKRNLRKAPPRVWNAAAENATGRDEYVRPGSHVESTVVTSISDEDGTVSHTPPSIQSQVVVDGDGDLKYRNGVRVAYAEQHRGSGDFVQHGRVRRVGDNLVLMPQRQQRPDADQDKTEDELLAKAHNQIAELEAMMRALEYKRKYKGT